MHTGTANASATVAGVADVTSGANADITTYVAEVSVDPRYEVRSKSYCSAIDLALLTKVLPACACSDISQSYGDSVLI